MVRTLPDVSAVGALVTSDSSLESDPPGEKLQASETSKGRMRANNGSLDLRNIFSPCLRKIIMGRMHKSLSNLINKVNNM